MNDFSIYGMKYKMDLIPPPEIYKLYSNWRLTCIIFSQSENIK